MKTIPYIKKLTTAGTQYIGTSLQDTEFILTQCNTISRLAPYVPRLMIAHPNYLKQSTGKHNTPQSLCEGIIDNFNSGQYDFSLKQCEALKLVFAIGEEEIEDFHTVEFEEVPKLPKLKALAPVVASEQKGTTMSDLFDIESITVVYRKGE